MKEAKQALENMEKTLQEKKKTESKELVAAIKHNQEIKERKEKESEEKKR